MVVDAYLLDTLTEQAKLSPRRRMHLDLRNSPSDGSQRIINAIEPGSEEIIHRHCNTSETVVILRGHLQEVFYTAQGKVKSVIDLVPGSSIVAVNVPAGQWHTTRSKESGTVILAMKNGKYEPAKEEDILRV